MNDSPIKKKPLDISISGQSAALFVTQDDSLASLLLDHGITIRDFMLLSLLSDQGSMSNIELARAVGIEPENVLQSLKRLAAEGLVLREPDSTDSEEETLTKLTGRGEDIAKRIKDQ